MECENTNLKEDLHFTFHSLHRLKCIQQFGLLPVNGSLQLCCQGTEAVMQRTWVWIPLKFRNCFAANLQNIVYIKECKSVSVERKCSYCNRSTSQRIIMTRTTSLQFFSQPCLLCPCVSAVTLWLDEESSESYSSAFFFRLKGKSKKEGFRHVQCMQLHV